MADLYKNIKALCDERGIKGGRMCKELGLSASVLTDLKAGRKTGITMPTAQKIADYFNVPLSAVLDGKKETPAAAIGNERDSESVSRELLELLLSLSPEQERQVMVYIRFLKNQ